jgi:glycine/D-amino acid oxidase-like deaminating enzyme
MYDSRHGSKQPLVRSHWLREALATDSDVRPPLRGAERADVAILGGGMCGLWTALELKLREPALDVAVVERDICGGGSSSRNAGYVMDLSGKFLALQHLYGTDEAIRVCKASTECVGEIQSFCQEHGIDAGFRVNGWLWGATCERQARCWTATIEALARVHQAPFVEVSKAQIGRYGLRGHVAGVLQPSVARLQPAKLVRGIRRVALEKGVRIYENSQVTRVSRGPVCTVHTGEGTLSAKNVVIALNSWGVMFPEIRRSVVVTAADACVTAPRPDLIAKLGWANGPAFTDSRRMIVHYRATEDGRIEMGKAGGMLAFGNQVGTRFDGAALRVREILEDVAAAVPELEGVASESSWMGPIDKSFYGLPAATPFPHDENMFYGCGFSGNGITSTKLIGKILASLVLRRKDRWSSLGLANPLPGTFPREPIRYVGGRLVLAAIKRNDRLDHEDKDADWMTHFLVSRMPGQVVPTKQTAAGAV